VSAEYIRCTHCAAIAPDAPLTPPAEAPAEAEAEAEGLDDAGPAAGEEARDEPAAARAPRNGARKRAVPGVGKKGAKGGARSPRAAQGRGGGGGRGARADPPESPGTGRVLRKTPERAARVGERHSPRLARKRARGG
jgi:hypothetical protein